MRNDKNIMQREYTRMFTERGRRKVCEGNLHGFPGQFLFKHSTNHCHHLNKALSRRRPALVCVLDFSLKLQAASIESRSFRVWFLSQSRASGQHACSGAKSTSHISIEGHRFFKNSGKTVPLFRMIYTRISKRFTLLFTGDTNIRFSRGSKP